MAMTEEDIKRQARCRAAIDKHRAFKAQFYADRKAKIEEAKTVISDELAVEEKAFSPADNDARIERQAIAQTIERKEISVGKNKISIKDEPTLDASAQEMNNVMKENGFVNEAGEGSVAEFLKWYEPLIFQVFKECNPISGFCDRCGLKEIGEQSCLKMFGEDNWCGKTMPNKAPEIAYYLSWKVGIMNGGLEKDSQITDGKIQGPPWFIHGCKKGHGFYMLQSERKAPPEGIDLYWKV